MRLMTTLSSGLSGAASQSQGWERMSSGEGRDSARVLVGGWVGAGSERRVQEPPHATRHSRLPAHPSHPPSRLAHPPACPAAGAAGAWPVRRFGARARCRNQCAHAAPCRRCPPLRVSVWVGGLVGAGVQGGQDNRVWATHQPRLAAPRPPQRVQPPHAPCARACESACRGARTGTAQSLLP